MKTAVITGVSGMDGTMLARYLLGLNYKVVGIIRRNSTSNEERLALIKKSDNLVLVYGDVTDGSSIDRVVQEYKPDEFYHLAANSFVGHS
jgi:GDPmannose 4,6-dehydratase